MLVHRIVAATQTVVNHRPLPGGPHRRGDFRATSAIGMFETRDTKPEPAGWPR